MTDSEAMLNRLILSKEDTTGISSGLLNFLIALENSLNAWFPSPSSSPIII
jgi:hypothetical protein